MRVFFNTLLLIIIIICVGAPFVTGYIIENRYNALIQKLNMGYADRMNFEGKFQRGFFTSHATTTIIDSNDEKVVLDHKIYHGPIVFKYTGWLKAINYKPQAIALAVIDTQILGPVSDQISVLYQDHQAYLISTTVEFNSDSHTKITNYPLKVTLGNKDIDWKGFSGDLDIIYDTADISLTVDAPDLKYTELTLNNSSRVLEISNIKLNFKRNMVTANEVFDLTIGDVKLNDGANFMFDVENIVLKLDTTMLQGIMNLVFDFNFVKLQSESQSAGPLTFELKLQNLNYDAITDLRRTTLPLAMQQQSVMTAPMAATLQQTKIRESLLKDRPIIDVNLACTIPLGEIMYKGHLEIGGPNVANMSAEQIWAQAMLTKNLKVSKAIVNKILLKYARQKFDNNAKMYAAMYPDPNIANPYNSMSEQQRKSTLANWANNVLYILKQKQIIIEQDDYIVINLQFSNDMLVINGKKMTQQDIDEITPMLAMPMLAPLTPVQNINSPTNETTTSVTTTPSTTENPAIPSPLMTTPSTTENSAPPIPNSPVDASSKDASFNDKLSIHTTPQPNSVDDHNSSAVEPLPEEANS